MVRTSKAKPGSGFSGLLKSRRLEAEMTQADLASRSALTAAYISQLESGKKPPPSDEVVRRISSALDVDSAELLELAHLEKTPKDVRRKVRLLDARLTRQRKITRTLLDDMLPLTLFNFLTRPGTLRRALKTRRVGERGRAVLARVEEKIGTFDSFRDFRQRSREAISGLKEEEREDLVETLQYMADWESGVPAPSGEEETVRRLPVFEAPPPGAPGDNLDAAKGFLLVAESRWKPSRYALSVEGDAMFPRIEPGDLVVFDERMIAKNGDVVAAVLEAGGWLMGKYMKLDEEIEIAPVNPSVPPSRFPRGRGRPKGYLLRGVAIELVRALR